MHAFNWKNGFTPKKGYCSTTLKALTHAHITRTLNLTLRFAYFFVPVPSASLVVLSTGHGFNTGSHSTSRLHTSRREALFEIRDRYMHCTCIKFNCNTRVVRTYVKRNGPFRVRAWFVRSPFNSRLTSVFIKRSSVKRTVHGRFFLVHTVSVADFE